MVGYYDGHRLHRVQLERALVYNEYPLTMSSFTTSTLLQRVRLQWEWKFMMWSYDGHLLQRVRLGRAPVYNEEFLFVFPFSLLAGLLENKYRLK